MFGGMSGGKMVGCGSDNMYSGDSNRDSNGVSNGNSNNNAVSVGNWDRYGINDAVRVGNGDGYGDSIGYWD
jgi:hypothetical protein